MKSVTNNFLVIDINRFFVLFILFAFDGFFIFRSVFLNFICFFCIVAAVENKFRYLALFLLSKLVRQFYSVKFLVIFFGSVYFGFVSFLGGFCFLFADFFVQSVNYTFSNVKFSGERCLLRFGLLFFGLFALA